MSTAIQEKTDRYAGWDTEDLFFDTDSFFADLLSAVAKAQESVSLETYIFHMQKIGHRLCERLKAASERGVKVRILVDGIGSHGWTDDLFSYFKGTTVQVRIYHPVPGLRYVRDANDSELGKNVSRIWKNVNKRNHRKTCIIDESLAWVGSANVADYHCSEFSGDKAWRDTSVRVSGEQVSALIYAFERAWNTARTLSFNRFKRIAQKYDYRKALVRLNFNYRLRRLFYKDLLLKVRAARERILITNAYFVPRRSLFKALAAAAKRGVSVQIVVPAASDVFFLPWVSYAYYGHLIKHNVRIFEYLPCMLHAKTMIIDDYYSVGSANLNHRSFQHDLESELRVTHPGNQHAMERQFTADLDRSREVTKDSLRQYPLWKRILSRILLRFRYLL